MQTWHFNISGQILIDGMEDKTMSIKPENIKTIIRISDYLNEFMPKFMMRLSIDKNLFDIIAKNAKNARMYLKIDKFDKQSDTVSTVPEPYIEDEFSIFISKDINYNKEIDYKEHEVLGNREREDVYKEVFIGLVPKSDINANKVLANAVAHKSTMMNIAASYLSKLHLLIEPFKYNPVKDQLIIPPQETLVKTIAFLNSVSVFYDTQYIFFMDEPSCTYLISRSGDGIEKIDDVYKNVYLNIHQTDDPGAVVPGMTVDTNKQQYYVDINVLDSKYNIDHDTAKILDKYKDIINPNKDNIQSTLNSIMDAAETIQNVMGDLKGAAESFGNTIKNAPNMLFNLSNTVNYSVKDNITPTVSSVNSEVQKAVSIIQALPETVTTSTQPSGGGTPSTNSYAIMTKSDKDRICKELTDELAVLQSNYNSTAELNDKFKTITDDTSDILYKGQKIDNHMGCFSYVNAQDAVRNTQKDIGVLSNSVDDLKISSKQNIVNNQHYPKDMAANMDNLYMMVKAIRQSLEGKTQGISNAPSSITGSVSGLKAIEDSLNKSNVVITDNVNNIDGSLLSYLKLPPQISNMTENLSPISTRLNSIVNLNLKSKFKSITTDIRNLGDTAMNAIHKIQDIGKNVNLSFNYSDLNSLRNDINAISDLSGIGKLGISSFESKLKLGGCFGTGNEGVKILRMKNDNANMVKNIQSEMENMVNQLSVNKYDLDPSVFTPNKKYTIKNYHGHNDKDGIFLLNKKTEVYVREDDTFTCNTMLDFCRVLNKNSKDNGDSGAHNTQNPENNNTIETQAYKTVEQNLGLNASGFNLSSIVNTNPNIGLKYLDDPASHGFGAGIGVNGNNNKVLGSSSISDIMKSINR